MTYNPAYDAQAVRAAGLAVDLPLSVRLYLDKTTGLYHYAEHAPGERRQTHALCGEDLASMRERPFFPVGDYRGLVVYERGCDECRNQLTV